MDRRGFFRSLFTRAAAVVVAQVVPAPIAPSWSRDFDFTSMDVTTVQWESLGGIKENFKVVILFTRPPTGTDGL